jgi:8-oxo-dGTP pyrophosphatase MutT (NUDIX family)
MNSTTAKDAAIESIAKVLIVDNTRRALILILGKHLKHPEKSFLPDLPGGIVDVGESERDAAVREAKEESGIDLDVKGVYLAYAETEFYPKEKKSVSKLLYISVLDNTPDVSLSWEHSDYKWVPLAELLESTALRPFFQEAVKYSLANDLL